MTADPKTIPVEELRRAAQALTTRGGARRILMLPIAKRFVRSLIEDAFPAEPRGLAYEDELTDLVRFLAACPADDSATEEVARAAVALAESYILPFDVADPVDQALLDLLRATAIYFVRLGAVSLAQKEIDNLGQEP